MRGTEKMRMIRDFKRSRVGMPMTGNRRRRRDHNLHCNSCTVLFLIYKVSCQTTNINKVLQSLVNNGQHRNCGFPDQIRFENVENAFGTNKRSS